VFSFRSKCVLSLSAKSSFPACWAAFIAVLVLAFGTGASGAGAAGPERPTARPGELIVRYLAPQSAPRTPLSPRTALSLRSAAEVEQSPNRPPSLKALDRKFGLTSAKPLFDRAPHPSRRGAASADNSPKPSAAALATGAASADNSKPSAAALAADTATKPSAAALAYDAPFESALWVIRLDPATDLEAARKAYAADPNVLYAEVNWEGTLCYVPTDPLYAQTASDLAIIGMEEAWAVQAGCGTGVPPVVAVIDSGVEPYHPDLAPALDLANSWNFTDNNANVFDDLGHGTRVAGIIGAAGNNAEGIAGVAFGCALLSLDVATSAGVVTTADVASAINWAVARGADVVNMSLRFSGASQTLQNACDAAAAAGVLLVAAAGNENQGDLPVYPASYDSVIGVGAVMDDGAARAPFSNYNNLQKNLVELVAPGSTVFSTIPGSQYNGTYGSGTSFAAPMVSGVAALLKAHYPGQSAAAIRAHLDATCKSVGQAFQPANSAGAGLLDAKTALETPMTPDISVVSVTVDDNTAYDPDNDGDGALDKGETARLVVTLSSLAADALGVSGVLSSSNTSLTLSGDLTALFGDVRHGAAASNAADAFSTITVAALAPVQKAVFQIALSGAGGFSANLHFELPIENELAISGVKSNQTFTSATTYHVTANLSLRGTTTIQPGTLFKVDPGVDIRADTGCALQAVGTAAAPIRFTAAKPFVAPPSGGSGAGAGAGLSNPNNIGPKTEAVNTASYQQLRYVSASTGTDTSAAGSVSSPWRSIQYALGQISDASASKKYALLVAEGNYTGTGDQVLTMKEHVDLYGGFQASDWSRDIAAHVSTIDGENARRGVNGANNARLDGFTVTKGKTIDYGGGISCSGSSPTITNCAITSNSLTSGSGGGIYCVGAASPTIANCAITGNSAAWGGGVYCYCSSPLIMNCVITGNSRSGITCYSSAPSIANCAVTSNTSDGAGGGVGCELSSPTLTSCAITGNSAAVGGGVCCWSSSPTITNCAITGNAADYGGGISCGGFFLSITNCAITGNSAEETGGGISCEGSFLSITNCAIRLNGSTPIYVSGASPTVRYSNIEGGWSGLGGNNMDTDPRFVSPLFWGTATDVVYDATAFSSELRHHGDPLLEGCLTGRVIRMGSYYYSVQSNTADTITVWGDATRGGAVGPPQAWRVEEYHILPTSPNRGAGIGPGADSTVPTTDMDGDARSGMTCDIGPDEYNATTAPGGNWGRLWVTTGASSASFAHCVVEKGAGLLAEIPNVTVSQCLLWGNTEFGARLTAGTAEVSDTTATLNMGPGIDAAGMRPLTRCAALWNGAAGLIGTTLTTCTVYGNGADGLSGASAAGSTSEFNAGNGFTLTAGATDCTARDNRGNGIVTTGGNVANCEASLNTGRGLEISGGGTAWGCTASYNGGGGILTDGSSVTNCAVEGNTGVGVTGSGGSTVSNTRIMGNTGAAISGVTTVQNCAVAGNTPGVTGASAVSSSYVGDNVGDGVAGGAISNSTILGNTASGVNSLASLSNSWIVGNGSYGVYSLVGFGAISDSWVAGNGSDGIFSSGGVGTVSNSSILNNGGIGTRNILSLTGSNIHGNGGAWQTHDNVSAGSGDRNFTNNWWGGDNTALLDAGGEWANMPFLQDTQDGSGNWLIDVWPYRTSAAPNAPDTSLTPALLLTVTPNPDNAANVGWTTFTLTFSEAMDPNPPSAAVVSVSFGRSAPYTANVVQPYPGYLPDQKTWQGRFAVGSGTGDGVNTIRVSNAVSADGFLIPDDTAHTFVIDTTGAGAANNGIALAMGTTMKLMWSEGSKPAGALGYNVRRSGSGLPGTYQKINGSIVTAASYMDTGIQSHTLYFYVVDLVDANHNSTQWTPPFFGRTESITRSEREWTLYE